MRFSVDPWDPDYGTSSEGSGEEASVSVELDTELPVEVWHPIRPSIPAGGHVTVIDGVRRVEARVWIDSVDGGMPGVCASWAAGALRCTNGTAELADITVGRSLAAPGPVEALLPIETAHGIYEPVTAGDGRPEQLWLAVQNAMGRAERRITDQVLVDAPDGLVIVDGPLRGVEHLGQVVGLVKTHHVRYLEGAPSRILAALGAMERTPVFTIAGGYTRHSWYARLPAPETAGVPMAGIVRCECPVGATGAALSELADRATVEMCRLASEPHKDRRAPQNLYPIAGLERLLRHRLGDPRLLYRSLRMAASA